MTASTHRLIDFYRGTGTDHRGGRFEDVIGMEDSQLERTHDYIQWLFPTVTTSPFNPDAPSLDATTISRLRAGFVAQAMLASCGLEVDVADLADPEVVPGSAFDARSRTSLTPGNQSFRWLTRMLGSLGVLGRRPQAEALFRCRESLYCNRHGGEIGDHAISHWRRRLS